MCRVTQCCCGCSLETGCKILAFLGLIFGGIGLVQGAIDSLVVEASTILKVISNVCCIVASAILLYGAV